MADNKELVLGCLRARQSGDLETYAQFLHDDVVRFGPRPSIDHVARGKAEVLSGVRVDLFQAGSLRMEVEHVVAEGNFVAVQFILRGTTVTGKDFENYQHFLFECRDGTVVSEWEYLDTLYSSGVLADVLEAHSAESPEPT
jgi:ketosteroid isomerase-like protein